MQNESSLPRHVGLIADGNRRWANEHGLPSFEGHRKGFEAGKKIIETAHARGISEFTAWAFSTENWDRSKEEISYLMHLFEEWLDKFYSQFEGKNVCIRVIGQKSRLPLSLQNKIKDVERKTAKNSGMVFNLALSYGGRDEIVQGIKTIISKGIKAEDVTEKTVSDSLWLPDIDLVIRTGGEQRLSGFLAWQSTYAELFFVKKYLPDLNPDDFDGILAEYRQRQRRFGK